MKARGTKGEVGFWQVSDFTSSSAAKKNDSLPRSKVVIGNYGSRPTSSRASVSVRKRKGKARQCKRNEEWRSPMHFTTIPYANTE
jgi:hypothetical protein